MIFKSNIKYVFCNTPFKAFLEGQISQGNFLYCPRFFILTRNLNAARTPTEMKQPVALNFAPL